MTTDKQKLQPLLWSVVGAFAQGDHDLQRRMDALDEFLGEVTVEQVALDLLEENRRLAARLRAAEARQQEVAA
ncbi:hypothetical protein P5705_05010 [Pseudomonas entomophila]|uniref:hypothetical protein n=1 Tax=Pseudomonas entomophila TaxID=312306 RepID=UPI00240700BF|nr:hypothetical protein [Pseudomonas entomophila]MDF9616992.1 hypothetical protein [Pseudomonas entomophila]